MNDLSKKGPGNQLARIPFTWQSTTVPEMPLTLPVAVEISVTPETMEVHAKRSGTIGELIGTNSAVDAHLQLQRADIVGVEVFLMPDISEDADWQWVQDADLSWVFLRHRDPFGIEPFFESLFTSHKRYWPKALVKVLKERMGIEASMTVESKDSRKVRLIRENVRH